MIVKYRKIYKYLILEPLLMALQKLETIIRKAAKPIIPILTAGTIAFTSLSCFTQATPPPTYNPPPITTPTQPTQPAPTIDIISKQEFRKDYKYLLSIDKFEANIESNKLVNRINDYIYFNLTGKNPATDVTSVVLSKDDMRWFLKYYVPQYSIIGGTVVPTALIKNNPDALKVFKKYGFSENIKAKYVTIVLGSRPKSEMVLEAALHETGHAIDFLNTRNFRQYSGNKIALPQNELDFYQSTFDESIAGLYFVAASRFAEKEAPDLSLKDNVIRGDVELLMYTDPAKLFDPAANINEWSAPFEELIPWLALFEEPDLAHLKDELKTNNMLSLKSTLELQTYLISTPRNKRADYAYNLFNSPNYKTNMAEIRGIATIRYYNTINPQAISSLYPIVHMP